MTIAGALQATARWSARALGRESFVVRSVRPAYETLLEYVSRGRGVHWTINGVTFHVDPRHRHQLSPNYDAPVAAFLAKRVRPGDLCINVGANVGVYVLQFANWSKPAGRVVAFEPNPWALAVLRRHIAMNGLSDRVDVVPAAVADAAGNGVLHACGADGMSRLSTSNPELEGRTSALRVPVLTLDDYCEQGVVAPAWLIVDVEGFELSVLAGARRLLASRGHNLQILVEMHPDSWALTGHTRSSAEELLVEIKRTPIALSCQGDPLGAHGMVCLEPI
jgi:FkbM family methyltransferase